MKMKTKFAWTLGVLVSLSGSTSIVVGAQQRAPASAEATASDEADPMDIETDLQLQGIVLENDSTTNSSPNLPFAEIEIFKNTARAGLRINGAEEEFVVVSVNGIIRTAYVSSAATDGFAKDPRYTQPVKKSTPEFQNIRLTIPRVGGNSTPYPWMRSKTFGSSTMYWGLQIHNGFFIHSTPHYGALGTPASMGCVRVDFPAAMELFDLVVNEVKGNAVISVYGSAQGEKGRASLETKLHDSGLQLTDIQAMVDSDLADAHAVSKGDYNGMGHKRRNQSSVAWPTCGGKDCFEAFGKREPI